MSLLHVARHALLGLLLLGVAVLGHASERRAPVKWNDGTGASFRGGSTVGDGPSNPSNGDFTASIDGYYTIRVTGKSYSTPEQLLARVVAFGASTFPAGGTCQSEPSWNALGCTVTGSASTGLATCRYQATATTVNNHSICSGQEGQPLVFDQVVYTSKNCLGNTYFNVGTRECECNIGVWDEETSWCIPVVDRMHLVPCDVCYGNPIMPTVGAKTQSVDAGWQPWVPLRLTYNSGRKVPYQAGSGKPFVRSESRNVGSIWTLSTDRQLLIDSPDYVRVVNVSRGDGMWTSFTRTASAEFAPASGLLNDRIRAVAGPGFQYFDQSAMTIESYSYTGQLLGIAHIGGRAMSFTYSDATTVPSLVRDIGLPLAMKDQTGREWKLGYEYLGEDVPPRITSITDPGNGRVDLEFGIEDQLRKVTWPDGRFRQFLYENATYSWALTGYLDENNVRAGRYSYDAQGRAISTERALGLDRYAVTWTRPSEWRVVESWDEGTGRLLRNHTLAPPEGMTVTLPSGESQAVSASSLLGSVKWTSKTQAAGAGSAAATTSRVLDANQNVVQLDDYNGSRSCMAYDMTRNLETSRVEGLTAATACASVTGGTLPTGSRKVSSQWHPDWRLTTATAEPRRLTTLVYNGQPDPFNGGTVASCAPTDALLPDGKPIVVLCKRVEQATTDETGALGFAATLQSGVAARTASWTYNAVGQVLTAKDSTGRTTVTNEYYADATTEHAKGDLKSSRNAVGHITSYSKYDAYGNVLEMTDANNVLTTFVYDLRQRLKSVTTAGVTMSYSYLPTGPLQRVDQPDGSFVSYEYDDARRLVAVSDNLNNRVDYTLDASGNRTQERTKDPQGLLKRTMSRTYDALNRAQQTTGRE
ncbi:RHS repeat domain-containing protein [Roseateles sp. L2-2]|uniref:RHS repeat domain-containing protein n=1 Tax=Roseateles sp. L2-2 TaxID=3422597 RepID=UPI003D360CA6